MRVRVLAGSCFPKDTQALVRMASGHDISMSIVENVVAYNDARKKSMAGRIIDAAGGDVAGKGGCRFGLGV